MLPDFPRKLKLTIACAVIALGGAAVGGWNYHRRHVDLRTELLEDARRSALAFDLVELDPLAGTKEDAVAPRYAMVKDRLRKLKTVDPRARFVGLFRFYPDTGKVVLLADSLDAGVNAGSQPGGSHVDVPVSAGLQEIIGTGQPSTEGPIADADGTWISSYAIIGSATGDARAARDILRLDVDAAGWRHELWRAAFEGAFYVWIALGLPLVAWIIARRQLEQRDVIRNLSEAVEQSHSAIVIIGLHGHLDFVNRGLCQQVGYSRSELVGRTWRDFRAAETSDEVLADLVTTVQAGRTWEGEWFNKRQNGSVYPVRGVVTPVKQRDGALACFVAVFDDVTEAKEREAELREARDLAQAGDRAKGHFLATMSHEVRTPLNGIVGFTSLLLDTPLTSEQSEYVQTIRMSTEALIQLTGDILDFARIESGKLKLDPGACDPRECVEDVLDLLAPKADAKKIELLHNVGEDVPAAIVTDAGRLRQVIANLVGNAVKFTESGEVEVSVRRLDPASHLASSSATTETCVLEFAVRDTGIGIAPEHHAKLFRAFSQVDESTTRRYSGTGLGLAICRELVELMGGTIRLESVPGRGATFRFTLSAPVAAPMPPVRNLTGLRMGMVVPPGSLREELAQLVRGWGGEVIEADSPDRLSPAEADIVLVQVDEASARELAARPAPLFGLVPDKLLGLVPVSLSSELRAGLRTHFRLLVNKPVHHDGFYALLAGSVGNRPSPESPAHFGLRVLTVEDNAVNLRLVERVLANLGCTSMAAENGCAALDLLRERPGEFDLVLLDLHMPEMDGIETLRAMRAGKAGPHAQTMWVIALTADAREEQRERAMAAGLNDYLTKPLQRGDLEVALWKFRAHHAPRKE